MQRGEAPLADVRRPKQPLLQRAADVGRGQQVACDASIAAFDFFDRHPSLRAHVLAFDGDHPVREIFADLFLLLAIETSSMTLTWIKGMLSPVVRLTNEGICARRVRAKRPHCETFISPKSWGLLYSSPDSY